MKIKMGLLLLGFCATAGAARTVKVGDSVTYRYSETQQSGQVILQRHLIVREISPVTQNVVLEDTYLKNNKIVSRFEVTYQKSDLASSDDLVSFIVDCSTKWNGKVTPLMTLAGSFQACERTNSQGDLSWLGQAPIFGILKEQGDEGNFEVEKMVFVDL
jgi:hypothetical protein